MTDAYWTPDREALWERLDSIASYAEDELNRYRPVTREIRIHTSAPNSNGINADEKPDTWYWETSATHINPDIVASLLSDAVAGDVTVRERPDDWEDGYWFVCDPDEVAP